MNTEPAMAMFATPEHENGCAAANRHPHLTRGISARSWRRERLLHSPLYGEGLGESSGEGDKERLQRLPP